MLVQDFLLENHIDLVKKWVEKLMATYPEGSSRFLLGQKDRFANPLGYKVSDGLENLYKALRGGMEEEEMRPHLEELIKIRAVQDFSPTAAVRFVFDIRQIVRDEAAKQKVELAEDDWHAFICRVDELALLTFELFTASRERLHQVRMQELKSGNYVITDNAVCPSKLMQRRQERENEKGNKISVNHDAR